MVLDTFPALLGIAGALFADLWCFLSRLGSICQGLAFDSVAYHALAVSADTARLGITFDMLSRLGSIC